MNPNDTHALYRFYDATGALLYVGIAADPGSRWRKHAGDKPWWHEVRGITVETYPDRETVLAAERRAIQVENPRYNIQRPTQPGSKKSTQRERPTRLVWICHECKQPIADGHGYLHVGTRARQVHRDFHRARRAQQASAYVDISDLRQWPEQAPWLAHHAACDPDPEHACYWFDVAGARTHAQLLDRTAHLLEKNWITSTDWDRLIRRMAGVDA